MSLLRTAWCRRIGAASFLHREDGALTALAIVLFVVLAAFGGLAIDLGRLYSEHGQTQDFVDHVALASAAELDGRSGAIDRATKAAVQIGGVGPLVNGKQNFATGVAALAVSKVTFLSKLGTDLGATDATPLPGDVVQCTYTVSTADYSPMDCENDDDVINTTQFVEVVTTSRQVTYYVLPVANLFLSAANRPPLSSNVQLKATAGFVREVCNNTPLMICNPNEANNVKFSLPMGSQILVKEQGGGNKWGPGDWGLMQIYGLKLEEGLALINPNTQCVRQLPDVKSGQTTGPVSDGMNVRFDMYSGNLKKENDNPDYAPAANVIKGLATGNNCKTAKSGSSIPFPRDNCFMVAPTPGAGTNCTTYNSEPRFGDGNWARDAYWASNHPGVPKPAAADGYDFPNMTRYDIYRYEIDHFPLPNGFSVGNGNGQEVSHPVCSNNSYDNANRDRRTLIVAIVDCLANSPKAGLKIEAWAKTFLTEPVGNSDWSNYQQAGSTIKFGEATNKTILVEYNGLIEPGDATGVLHVFPVLYR